MLFHQYKSKTQRFRQGRHEGERSWRPGRVRYNKISRTSPLVFLSHETRRILNARMAAVLASRL